MHVYEQKIYSSDPTCSCFAGSMARNDALQVDIPQLMQLYKNIILCNQKNVLSVIVSGIIRSFNQLQRLEIVVVRMRTMPKFILLVV